MKINTAFNRWFACCCAFIVLMLAVRINYSGSHAFIFLLWNLFLAWIPFVFSEMLERAFSKAKLKQALLFMSWLIFFPNALYIVTDIIHLEERNPVPLWFDALLLFAVSFAGLALAFASLINVEIYLRKLFSEHRVALLVVVLLFAGSFGVFLGRFQRWNSWNVINDPLRLAKDVLKRFTNPADHYRSWVIVFFLTLLYCICWYCFKTFMKVSKANNPG